MGDFRMNKIFWFLCLFLFGTCFAGCSDPVERWEGRISPSKNNPAIYIKIGEFHSLESCRFTATDKLRAMRISESGDYECAKNCRIEPVSLARNCEETSK